MTADIVLTIKMYGLAIFVSILVAVMIRGIVVVLEAIQKKPEKPPAAVPAAAPAPAQDVTENDIAAIAAAVYAMLGTVRIVSIEDTGRGRAWTHRGRFMHQASRPNRG